MNIPSLPMKYIITHAKPLREVAPPKLSRGWPLLRLSLTLKAHSVRQKHGLGVAPGIILT